MERQFHYNEDKQYNQVRYISKTQEHRNHDLPATRGLDFRYYYWFKNGYEHREKNLPTSIEPNGSRAYMYYGEFSTKNNLCWIDADGDRD